MKKSFINYFSLGYDARVGFGFEKSRSRARCWNKCIYFWEGLKKNCCRKTIPLTSFIESFQVLDMDSTINKNEKNPFVKNGTDEDINNKDKININNLNESDQVFEKAAKLSKVKTFIKTKKSTSDLRNQDSKCY